MLNIWPLTVTLTLTWHTGNMGYAHPLVEVNVSFKFEGNPSISIGVIERTRIGDGRTDGQTDRPIDGRTDATKRIQYSTPHILWWGYNNCILYLNFHSKNPYREKENVCANFKFLNTSFCTHTKTAPTNNLYLHIIIHM